MSKFYSTIQFRCYTTKKGYRRLDEVLEMLRTLYNAGLQERKDAWKYNKIRVSMYDQTKQLTQIRGDDIKWKNLAIGIVRGPIFRLERSFNSFYTRVKKGQNPGFPRFKGKKQFSTIELAGLLSSNLKLFENKGIVKIKGLPILKFKCTREILDTYKIFTLKLVKKIKGWYLNIECEIIAQILPKTGQSVGIDVGVNQRLTLSTGEIVQRRVIDNKIKQLQQEFSKCLLKSNRRKKKLIELRREWYKEEIRNRNECHQITSDIIRRFDKIAIEKLDIKQMVKSISGSIENPGKGVQQKSNLNREVLLQTWGLIFQQLKYKAERAGREIVEINPKYTSKICSNCGDITPQDEYRTHRCVSCGLVIDRDFNAAINICNRAFGVNSSPTLRRELQTV